LTDSRQVPMQTLHLNFSTRHRDVTLPGKISNAKVLVFFVYQKVLKLFILRFRDWLSSAIGRWVMAEIASKFHKRLSRSLKGLAV